MLVNNLSLLNIGGGWEFDRSKGERMNIRNIVLARLEQAVAEHSPMPFPEQIDDDIELDIFGLDSLAFMELLTSIEKEVGFIGLGKCIR